MPEAARFCDQSPMVIPSTEPTWSGDLHGEVGAMQRAIEQRLLAGSFEMTVIPLPVRPAEKMIAYVSWAAGWMVFSGAIATVATMIFSLPG